MTKACSLLCAICAQPFEYEYLGGALRKNCDACNKEIERQRKRKENHKRDRATEAGRVAKALRKKNWEERNPQKAMGLKNRWHLQQRSGLKDCYIKTQIQNQAGLPFSEIPEELIEEKRKQLIAERLYRKAQKEIIHD